MYKGPIGIKKYKITAYRENYLSILALNADNHGDYNIMSLCRLSQY